MKTSKPASKTQLRRRADFLWSRAVRCLRADEQGFCTCVTCGVRKNWREVDAGHFMSRSYSATRYLLINGWPQCKPCNGGFGAKSWRVDTTVRSRYVAFLKRTLGEHVPEELRKMALSRKRLGIEDLRKIIWDLETLCMEEGVPI